MFQCPLRDQVVVREQIVLESLVQIGGGGESGLVDDVADASVEALDHAVGLRASWRAQAVLGADGLAGQVEYMLARRRLGAAGGGGGGMAGFSGRAGFYTHCG